MKNMVQEILLVSIITIISVTTALFIAQASNSLL